MFSCSCMFVTTIRLQSYCKQRPQYIQSNIHPPTCHKFTQKTRKQRRSNIQRNTIFYEKKSTQLIPAVTVLIPNNFFFFLVFFSPPFLMAFQHGLQLHSLSFHQQQQQPLTMPPLTALHGIYYTHKFLTISKLQLATKVVITVMILLRFNAVLKLEEPSKFLFLQKKMKVQKVLFFSKSLKNWIKLLLGNVESNIVSLPKLPKNKLLKKLRMKSFAGEY